MLGLLKDSLNLTLEEAKEGEKRCPFPGKWVLTNLTRVVFAP